MVASASSTAITSFSYGFRSQEPIFSSKVSSFTSTGRRVFGTIKAVQVTSQGNPRRRIQNVEGDIFVDNTCIDCDTCRWMVPEIFTRVDNMSAVVKQPTCEEEMLNALQDMEEEHISKMEKRRRRIWKHLFRSTERNNLFLLANPRKA